jgi:hypothetical protein
MMGRMSVCCECANVMCIQSELEGAVLRLNTSFVETLLYSQTTISRR